MPDDTALILPRGLIFDMDGTLTRPILDFPSIKAEMGIGSQPILEAMAKMGPGRRAEAEIVLHRHEDRAAMESELNPGCQALMEWIKSKKIPVGLVTRNRRSCVNTVLSRHGLKIDVAITREDGRHKPHPDPLFLVCQQMRQQPANVWMIGDGQYDIEAGLAAGMRTVWISHQERKGFSAEPWRIVPGLVELLELLKMAEAR